MALSNSATPTYYGRFRDAVLRGEIPVCREISMEMNRIDALIDDPKYFYDDQAIDGFIAYCETELCLTDGTKLQLLDSFKLWSEQIFGWWEYEEEEDWQEATPFQRAGKVINLVKKRLTKKQFLIVARGAAKSMYASCIQSYFLNIHTETTMQITTAPTMKQAEEVMAPIRTSITRARGPVFRILTQGSIHNTTGNRADRQWLASTKRGIDNFVTGSYLEIRPMSINKLQGLRPFVSSVDEWLSGDIREDVIGAIEQGATKLDDYLILAISSEGTVRNGAGDTIKMELADILKGEYAAPHVSVWHYKLDNQDEVGMPEMWLKANPNLGKIVTYKTYQQEVLRMQKAPSTYNDILAKRFGIPSEGTAYFFAFQDTVPLEVNLDFRGLMCAMGADLSQGDDFCAFTFLFPLADGAFGVKTRSYITERTLTRLMPAMRFKYDQFIEEGTLHIMNTTVLDMMDVYEDLDAHILTMGYDVRTLGYDPYNAIEFVKRWEMERTPYYVEKVIQGRKTESVPLGEIRLMAEQRMLLFNEWLMSYGMRNATTLEDNNGNRMLLKKRHEEKIDNVSALLDAWVAYKRNKDQFA